MKEYTADEIELANEIADTLEDRDSLALYLLFVDKYKEAHLRRLLDKVMALPAEKIKKTRGALFTFLVTQYETNVPRG